MNVFGGRWKQGSEITRDVLLEDGNWVLRTASPAIAASLVDDHNAALDAEAKEPEESDDERHQRVLRHIYGVVKCSAAHARRIETLEREVRELASSMTAMLARLDEAELSLANYLRRLDVHATHLTSAPWRPNYDRE